MINSDDFLKGLTTLYTWVKAVCNCKAKESCKYCRYLSDQSDQAYKQNVDEYDSIVTEFKDDMKKNELYQKELSKIPAINTNDSSID